MEEKDPLLADACAAALRMAGEGKPLTEVLALLAGAAESRAPVRSVSSILVIDGEGLLRNGASPNVPSDYLAAIDGLRPDAGVGTCAAAAATGRIVFTRSLYDDAAWAELRHLPLAIGYRSAWSMPIKRADDTVLGTFGSYFFEERVPTPAEQAVMARLVATAAELLGRPR